VDETNNIKKKYDCLASFRDLIEYPLEKIFYSKWRKDILNNLKGKILDAGVGSGKNLQYYSPDAEVTGIDISDKFMERARRRAKQLGRKYEFVQMDAQHLTFQENSFDYAVTTHLLCSVPNPVAVLREMKRVVKKRGKIIMIEHGLNKNKIIAFIENLVNPIIFWLLGFNINRNTRKNIEISGLKIIEDKRLSTKDIFANRKFVCIK